MYRCMVCEAPAQSPCTCADEVARDYEKAIGALSDPWGWKEESEKLDIQSGTRVKIDEVKEGVCTQ